VPTSCSANNYAHDADFYRAWARAVVDEAFDGPYTRKYAVGTAFLRGAGRGRVAEVTGSTRCGGNSARTSSRAVCPPSGHPRPTPTRATDTSWCATPTLEVVKAAMQTIIETVQIEYA
jgi:hypothetical protein